jgi:RNA polymerase sigma-70 factor (ECF subfamily)
MMSLQGSPRLGAHPPAGPSTAREPLAGRGGVYSRVAGASPGGVREREDRECLAAFDAELAYIFASLRRMGVAPGDLEDLAQEIFLVLRSRWSRIDATRPLRPYLFAVAFRVASAYRRRSRRLVVGTVPEVADSHDTPDRALQGKQVRALVARMLDKIPLPRRAVLIMHDLDETPVRDIAAALGISKFTVYARLRKGRAELAAAARALRHVL